MHQDYRKSRTFRTILFHLILLILIVLLCIETRALSVPQVTILDVLDGSAVRETITVQLENNTLKSLSFALPPGASSVVVNEYRVDLVNGSVDVPLSCKRCTFSVAYTLRDVVQTDSLDTLSFSRTLNLPESPVVLDYELRLPPASIVNAHSGDPPIVPAPTELRTDGQRIIILWRETSPSLPQRFFVRFSGGDPSATDLFFDELGEWQVWVVFVFALILGGVFGALVQRHLHERFSERTSLPFVPARLLSPDERTVIKFLHEHGTTGQKEIGKHLSWSKSKVSAIMTSLERKEIVSREKVGRNYKVTVEKAMRE
jgi:hypothetical protein